LLYQLSYLGAPARAYRGLGDRLSSNVTMRKIERRNPWREGGLWCKGGRSTETKPRARAI
jgi:hypothetical protein